MCQLITVLLAGGMLPCVAAAGDATPIPAAQAREHLGKPKVVVEFVVQKSKNRLGQRGIVYLDSESDYQHASNLGVAISAAAAEQLQAQGIHDPAEHFLGKRIRVEGCIMQFEERLYLPVLDAGKIRLVGDK